MLIILLAPLEPTNHIYVVSKVGPAEVQRVICPCINHENISSSRYSPVNDLASPSSDLRINLLVRTTSYNDGGLIINGVFGLMDHLILEWIGLL